MKRDEPKAGRAWHRIFSASLLYGLLLLAGCAGEGSRQGTAAQSPNPVPVGGIGGTGIVQGGIGGTGIVPDGIGGTGLVHNGVGGTGIVGAVSGFGSILVNGVEVTFDERTPTEINGVPASSEALAIGKIVAVEAVGSGRTLSARRIVVLSAVAGPVQAVDPGAGTMDVVGQRIRIGSAIVVGGQSGSGGNAPRLGDYVRVSGLRHSDGTLEATHIERAPRDETVLLVGPLEAQGGGFAVHEVPVTPGPGFDAKALAGQSVLVSGSWNGERIEAASIVANPVQALLGRTAGMSVQGYVSVQAGVARLDAAGVALVARTEARTTPGIVADYVLDQLGIAKGSMGPGGKLVMERFERQERVLSPGVGDSRGGAAPIDRSSRPDRPSIILPGGPPGGPPEGTPGGGPPGGEPPGRGPHGGGPPCGAPPCGAPPGGAPPGRGPPCGAPPCGGPPGGGPPGKPPH